MTAEASGAWTLDVWGQVRREIEAQQAGAETNAAILANALLAAQSALALAYVTLRQADLLENLLARTIEDYKRSVTITQNQYNAGTAAKSDVITAQAQLLNAQAALIAAGVSRAQSEHAIAVLMGRPPAGLSIPHGSLATRVPSVPVGLPSSLLERRPDVAAAEETMRQANAADRRRVRRAIFQPCRFPASSAIPAIRSQPSSARAILSGRSALRSLSLCSTAASPPPRSRRRARPIRRMSPLIARRC